jgi:hypothetical protein
VRNPKRASSARLLSSDAGAFTNMFTDYCGGNTWHGHTSRGPK